MPVADLRYLTAPAPLGLGLLFGATTLATAWLLGRALWPVGVRPVPYWAAVGLWLGVQGALSGASFYQGQLGSLPPRLALWGILPGLAAALAPLATGAGRRGLARLPPARLVDVSLVRVPVELVLYGLAAARLVPELLTFAGRNFDIAAGLTAAAVGWALRRGRLGAGGLLAWHLGALALLGNVVGLALLAAPSPLQRLAFEQPNVAVLRFPFAWLAVFVVPAVLFSHVAGLAQLPGRRASGTAG